MKLNRKKSVLFGIVAVVFLVPVALFCLPFLNLFHAHEHCIKQTGLTFRQYAVDHEGRFPLDTNGFGNALLLLVRSNYAQISHLTAPGDEGKIFKTALETGLPVPEDQCTRIYVQGLTETNYGGIALLWDRHSTPGGDHGRSPWGRLVREVCLLDGSMRVIEEKDWLAFSHEQIKLLVQAGISETTAHRYYQLP